MCKRQCQPVEGCLHASLHLQPVIGPLPEDQRAPHALPCLTLTPTHPPTPPAEVPSCCTPSSHAHCAPHFPYHPPLLSVHPACRYNVHLTPFHAEQLLLDVRIMMGIVLSQDEELKEPKGVMPPVRISAWDATHARTLRLQMLARSGCEGAHAPGPGTNACSGWRTRSNWLFLCWLACSWAPTLAGV